MAFEDIKPYSFSGLSREDMRKIGEEISQRYAVVPPSKTKSRTPSSSTEFAAKQSAVLKSYSKETLRSISEDINRRFSPKIGDLCLPDLLLLPVDPRHLYVFWHPGLLERKIPKPLVVRIFWRPEPLLNQMPAKIWFDVTIEAQKHRQKIRVPIDGTSYSAALGHVNADRSLEVIANSNIIHVPRIPEKTRPQPQSVSNANSRQSDPEAVGQTLQNLLSATEQDGIQYAPDWAVNLYLTSNPTSITDFAKIYVALMTLFNNRIDAELVALNEHASEPPVLNCNHSGTGL